MLRTALPEVSLALATIGARCTVLAMMRPGVLWTLSTACLCTLKRDLISNARSARIKSKPEGIKMGLKELYGIEESAITLGYIGNSPGTTNVFMC